MRKSKFSLFHPAHARGQSLTNRLHVNSARMRRILSKLEKIPNGNINDVRCAAGRLPKR
ncbi:hypothetical protein EV184_13046 [Sinorhizobium americanum]|uniref:Uncharacterized protein n=1 Tax=Sinorhizobium americanum TaxID=194963 RepID=A0A4R2B2J4_9HYPH|nr:hypothetical protein EV184_13046 [Sinorhizobium americanum]